MRKIRQLKYRRNRNAGFSLIELLLAMIVLAVGLLGAMIIILTAIVSNSRSRFDTAAVALAQSTMNRILVLSASAGVQQTQITDCNGTVHVMTTTPAPAPGAGAPLTDLANLGVSGNRIIDFTQPAVNGYQMMYTLCATGAADGLPTGIPQVYDVRWNVQRINDSSQLILVAAKNATETGNGIQNQSRLFMLPMTLRAVRGN